MKEEVDVDIEMEFAIKFTIYLYQKKVQFFFNHKQPNFDASKNKKIKNKSQKAIK